MSEHEKSLIDLVGSIELKEESGKSKGILGRVFKYFLIQFASAEGKNGVQFGDISIYGQESNATTRRLAIMNLAIRGIEADIGKQHTDTFRNMLYPQPSRN